MADEDDVWLPFSVGIDFDDNGKDKEKKHIMRHLKKRKVVFQITQPYFQIYSVMFFYLGSPSQDLGSRWVTLPFN